MSEEITLRDIIKAIVILKPGTTLAEAQLMMWAKTARSTMATAMHGIADQGFFTTKRVENKGRPGFKCNAYYPTERLLASFKVTREMQEYLGLTEVKLKPKKLKREYNTVFESCKQSAATKRVLWFYGRGELPEVEVR